MGASRRWVREVIIERCERERSSGESNPDRRPTKAVCCRKTARPSREAEVRVELTSSGLTVRCLARLLCRLHRSGPHGDRTCTLAADNRLLFYLSFRARERPAGVEPARP